jgi:hypothetical protein
MTRGHVPPDAADEYVPDEQAATRGNPPVGPQENPGDGDDSDDGDDGDGTPDYVCRQCEYTTQIETPNIRAENFCNGECKDFRIFIREDHYGQD